jgi:hypothetical protein
MWARSKYKPSIRPSSSFLGRGVPFKVSRVHAVFRHREGEVTKVVEWLGGGNDSRRIKD